MGGGTEGNLYASRYPSLDLVNKSSFLARNACIRLRGYSRLQGPSFQSAAVYYCNDGNRFKAVVPYPPCTGLVASEAVVEDLDLAGEDVQGE